MSVPVSRTVNRASAIAIAATMITILFSADGSGAAAQASQPQLVTVTAAESAPNPQFTVVPLVQPIPAEDAADNADSAGVVDAPSDVVDPPKVTSATLAALVAAQPASRELSRELDCLAGAIYFEAKGESLPGQLAVGRVIIARSKSGRFPDSYCGVVFQRSQFSFVRGHAMPGIDRRSRGWQNAAAIAQIAHAGSWHSQAEGALFFHAARVSPGWRLARVARIDNHIFYR